MVADSVLHFAHFTTGVALILLMATFMMRNLASHIEKLLEKYRTGNLKMIEVRICYEVVYFVVVAVLFLDYVPVIWRDALGYACKP